jgi:hypothetical protein
MSEGAGETMTGDGEAMEQDTGTEADGTMNDIGAMGG